MAGKERGSRSLQASDRLKRAEKSYHKGHYSAAGREAKSLLADLPSGTHGDLADSATLLALFAYARSGEFERGWELVERHRPRQAQYLDFCYAACYLAYQRCDYDNTERWGQQFLKRHGEVATGDPHRNTFDKLHEVLNTLGCAAKDRGHNERALGHLDAAILHQPDYPLPYLNAALVSQRQGDTEAARRYIESGLAACGPVEELQMVQQGLLRDRKISVCMIVKDEEEMLPGALESVRAVTDELIIVDTGSTDGTVAIAESFGARVYHHPWEHDFAKSRNRSIEYATGDWILVLDADERLTADTAPLVRKLANACLQDAVSFSVYNIDLDNDHVSFLPSIRMFRTDRNYRYKGIVHNQIDLPPETPVLRAPIRIDHYGYTPSVARKRGKFERTTHLLREQLAQNPDDAFAHFNMAQIMRGGETGRELAPQIIEHARRVTQILSPEDTDHLHVLLMAYHQLASAYFNQERYAEAEQACRTALEIKPDFIDALMTLGHTLSQQKCYDAAREAFLAYLRVRERYDEADETRGFILLNLSTQHQAYYGLGLAAEAQGQAPVALDWYRKVLTLKPYYLETHLRIGQICYQAGRADEAREAFDRELEYRPDSFWAHFCLGDLAAREARWPDALRHYQNAHVVRSDHPNLPLNIASAAYQAGQPDLAAEYLAGVQTDQASRPQARRLAAAVAFARGDYETARTSFQNYLEAVPGDAAAWSDLGNAHFRSGDLESALACYERALTHDGNLNVAQRNRAMVLVKQARFEEAREALTGYLERGPEDGEALLILADLWARDGRFREALPLYERYLRLVPDDLEAVFHLSQSYQAMGQQDAAAMGYRHVLAKQPGFSPARDALAALGLR